MNVCKRKKKLINCFIGLAIHMIYLLAMRRIEMKHQEINKYFTGQYNERHLFVK